MKKHYAIIAGMITTVVLMMVLNFNSVMHRDKISNTRPNASAISPTNMPNGATLNSIQDEIAKREYHITFDSTQRALQSPNRRHNLRAYYRPGNLTIRNRVDSAGHNFQMQLVNEGIFADGVLIAEAGTEARLDNRSDTLAIAHKDFTEEFINNQEGIRQNFIIPHAPTSTRQLFVRLSVRGLRARQESSDELIFYSDDKEGKSDRLRYSGLKCWDASGKALVSSLTLSGEQIQLNVNVSDATYPVTIDPIITNGNPGNADKTLEINQTSAWLGFSVSSAGDVNGDGYSDVLVGAPKYDNGQADEGAAFLYPGTAGGISLAATVLECNQANAQMGYSVSNAGDINNDGFSDILVGAPYYDAPASNEGAVFIYKGSAGGILKNTPYLFKLDQAEANLGISVAMAGDVNGDGYSDMLAGAHQFDNGQSNEGVGVLILGVANGLGLVTFLECNQKDAMMGFAVAGAGDVDGDGFSDVMAGARFYHNGQDYEGAAFIFKGSANGLVTGNPTVIEGNQFDARLGHALSSAGDVNGDGFSDIALGAYLYDKGSNNEGVVMIHLGSANGVATVPSQTLESDQQEAQFGISVACAGDVNGDGYADLIAGARYYDKGQGNEGAAFIYQGSAAGLNPIPISVLESNQGDAWLGSAVASAGDVNGDGFSDLLVGSYTFDHGQTDEGSVFVWYGNAGNISFLNPDTIKSNESGSYFGFSVNGIGDINGDGYGDAAATAPYYDAGQSGEGVVFIYYGSVSGLNLLAPVTLQVDQSYAHFGWKVSDSGDINGDGFADLIASSEFYSYQGKNYHGAVYTFWGSSAGLTLQPTSILLNPNNNSFFGSSISSAGDVDHDGYSDIVVGDYNYTDNEIITGAVFVYNGSPNGIPSQTVPIILQSTENDSGFGFSISDAGDVNDDGYADILVGCPKHSNGQFEEGAAYLYYGSQNGLQPASPTMVESNVDDAHFGSAVSGLGDANGDGFSDVVIGARYFSNGQNEEGAVFVFHGASQGLITNAPTSIESNINGAELGVSVASCGDINGDGYSDLLAGAHNFTNGQTEEGAAMIFCGGPNGIIKSQFVTIEGNIPYQHIGFSLSGMADVNGDGYGDVVLGGAATIQSQGLIMALYGNHGKNVKYLMRLYNSSDLTTPINHTQFPQPNFGAGLFAKSFTGRNKGKLIWETKPLAQGFSKGNNNRITNSTQSTGSQAAYSSLGTTGFELKNVIDKQGPGTKVRVRVKYDPVLALTGQTYGPWRYLPAYLMGNSTAPVPDEGPDDLSETIQNKAIHLEDENASELAAIYPNPVSNRLNIDIKDKDQVQNLKILTAAGSVVYQSNGFQPFIDVSKFSEGAYFLTITKTGGSHTSRQILIRR